jgi:hypothetical protein
MTNTRDDRPHEWQESSVSADGERREKWQRCPLYQADDKGAEAHYFLERMMVTYHDPDPFRWNLNAFVQALRSITFYIQKLLKHQDGFEAWYAAQQALMKADPLLQKFVEGRNILVKQRNLYVESAAVIGVYRYRKPRLGMHVNVPVYVSSRDLLKRADSLNLLDAERSAEEEEYGVEREWRVPELGDGNVLDLCDEAWIRLAGVLERAHDFIGWSSPGPRLHGHPSSAVKLLTETDVDPSLAEEWWGDQKAK